MGQNEVKLIITTDSSGAVVGIKALSGEVTGFTKKAADEHQTMAQRIKGCWLEVSAAAYGAYAAISKGFEYMELGAKSQQAEEAFRNVAASYKENADQLIADLKRASNATVDDSAIMQKAIKGLTQDLSGKDMTRLMEVARIEARRTGQDVGQTFDELVDAVSNNMPRALKRFGLITKEEMKNFEMAIAAGHTELSLLNIVLARGTLHTAALGGASENAAEKLQRLKAITNEVKEALGIGLYHAIYGVGTMFMETGKMIISPLALIEQGMNKLGVGGTIWQDTFKEQSRIAADWGNKMRGINGGTSPAGDTSGAKKDLDAIDKKLRDIAGQGKIDEAEKKLGEGRVHWLEGIKKEAAEAQKAIDDLAKSRGDAAKKWYDGMLQESEEAKKRPEQWKAIKEAVIQYQLSLIDVKEAELSISKADAASERLKLSQGLLKVQEDYLKSMDKIKDPAAWYAQADAIEETRKRLIELNKTLEEQTGTMGGGFSKGIKEWLQNVDTEFQSGKKLAEETARAMSDAFETFFFDVFEGRAKSFKEYFRSFVTSIEKMIAKMLAEKTTAAIIGTVADLVAGAATSSSTSTSSGSGSGMYQSGNSGWNSGGVSVKHHGGLIMHQGGYIPRFHAGGLNSDERPAILQTGEYVVSRRGVAALDRINTGEASGQPINVIVNVENKSSQPVNAKRGDTKFDGKQYVVGVILEDFGSNGPVYNAVRGVR